MGGTGEREEHALELPQSPGSTGVVRVLFVLRSHPHKGHEQVHWLPSHGRGVGSLAVDQRVGAFGAALLESALTSFGDLGSPHVAVLYSATV